MLLDPCVLNYLFVITMLMSIILRLLQIRRNVYLFRANDFAKNACRPKPVFKIGGSMIEFVYQGPYLGHILIDTFDDRISK